jgi:hypothetical protein
MDTHPSDWSYLKDGAGPPRDQFREAHDFDEAEPRPVTAPTRDDPRTAELTCGVAEAVGGHALRAGTGWDSRPSKGTCDCASPPVRHRGQSR